MSSRPPSPSHPTSAAARSHLRAALIALALSLGADRQILVADPPPVTSPSRAVSDATIPANPPDAPVHLVPQPPTRIRQVEPDVHLLDFDRVAFGNLRLLPARSAPTRVTVHFGEALTNGRVLRTPPGSVRYAAVTVHLKEGLPVVAAPAPDKRNTEIDHPRHPPAVLTPKEWGVVLPFRWVEIEGWPGPLDASQVVRQAAFLRSWDDEAAAFSCSDPMLDRIWELSRYTIKATTFAGIYLDGDRERIAYEADAHLNQLSHYATDRDLRMSRDTFDWLMRHPTWPTEWAPYMILIAHADWMHTADRAWLEPRYPALREKLLSHRARPDGLIHSDDEKLRRLDLVDWPPGERDGYVFTTANTVVNAFQLRALSCLAELARAVDRTSDANAWLALEAKTRMAFTQRFWDPERRLYLDGEDTSHTSLHANLFPLAFHLVPIEHRPHVADWLARRGMACSVYAAQYLLEGLFRNGAADRALRLMTADGDRSWKHMIESGATLTWEAWDQKYKPNQDWNHPWGAAPANLLPRFVLGAQPASPGWTRTLIRPHPGHLEFARGKVPTPHGPILIEWRRQPRFRLHLNLPTGIAAHISLPAPHDSSGVFRLDTPKPTRLTSRRQGDRWVPLQDLVGSTTLEVR